MRTYLWRAADRAVQQQAVRMSGGQGRWRCPLGSGALTAREGAHLARGRHLLEQINKPPGHYGYAVAETTHDCGVIGGQAQSRKRFLLVARHIEKVPPLPITLFR